MTIPDYELDRFGVIKITDHHNYIEHVSHMFLGSLGVKFTDLSAQRVMSTQEQN